MEWVWTELVLSVRVILWKMDLFLQQSSTGSAAAVAAAGSATVTQTLQPIVPIAMFVNEQLLSRSHWKYWIDTYYIILFKSRKHLAHTLTNVCLLENTCWSLTLKHLISFSIYSNPFITHVHLGKSWQKMQGGRPFKTTWKVDEPLAWLKNWPRIFLHCQMSRLLTERGSQLGARADAWCVSPPHGELQCSVMFN